MTEVSLVRPTRRATARRKMVVESSDDDVEMADAGPDQDDDSDEFTPAPPRTPRRQSRRKTTNRVPQTPRAAAAELKLMADDTMETTTLECIPVQPVQSESPRKRSSPRKRTTASTRIPSRAPVSMATSNQRDSGAPELSSVHAPPLGDITDVTLNSKSVAPPTEENRALRSMLPPLLEKPMDIVMRSRSMPQPATDENQGVKPRIVLTYLILTNFKSYAGRQEVGPFHASFSSVVGPNGSGKSNVIDSLLFVFGFRASKMRQGKISALIHKSAAFPDLGHCEVEVHFQEVRDVVSCDASLDAKRFSAHDP